MRQVTIGELEDWVQSGAVWRAVELSPEHAVIDLCTCSGEAMDRVKTEEPAVIEYVRSHQPG